MAFIKARLNRDNCWNMMFLVITASGIMFSEWLMSILSLHLLGLFMLIFSLIIVPGLIISLNSVSWIGGQTFVNKQGQVVNTKGLKWLLLVLPVIAGSIVVVPDFLETIFSSNALDLFIITVVFTSFFIAPVLFFMLINCPISILFNKNIYRSSVNGMSFQPVNVKQHDFQSLSSFHEKRISPCYYYLPYNIHYSNYRNR